MKKISAMLISASIGLMLAFNSQTVHLVSSQNNATPTATVDVIGAQATADVLRAQAAAAQAQADYQRNLATQQSYQATQQSAQSTQRAIEAMHVSASATATAYVPTATSIAATATATAQVPTATSIAATQQAIAIEATRSAKDAEDKQQAILDERTANERNRAVAFVGLIVLMIVLIGSTLIAGAALIRWGLKLKHPIQVVESVPLAAVFDAGAPTDVSQSTAVQVIDSDEFVDRLDDLFHGDE
jgi:hypothetical protein